MSKPKKKKQQRSEPQSGQAKPAEASAKTGASSLVPAGGGAAAAEFSTVVPDSDEPNVTVQPLPVLLIAFLGLMIYVADMYLMDRSGQFSDLVYYPHNQIPAPPGVDPEAGKRIYGLYCVACHQPTGTGNQDFPPLAGSDWVLAEGPNRIIRIVLNGLNGPIEVNGKTFNNTMVPWKSALTNDDIAAVLTYVRQSWGNDASSVDPEQVKAIREETAARSSPWTAAELERIPVID